MRSIVLGILCVHLFAPISSGAIIGFSGSGVKVAATSGYVMNSTPDSTGFGSDGTLSFAGISTSLQTGFDEKQDVLLTSDIVLSTGTILQGTVVNSHTIFLNTPDAESGTRVTDWIFDGPILGIATSTDGTEYASTNFLGKVGVLYTPVAFANEGLEAGDSFTLPAADTLSLTLGINQPGDWVRIFTLSSAVVVVPEPSSLALLVIGALGFSSRGWNRRRRSGGRP